jgi:sterol desaturase/sphingolipid hydroxylase (fatty acid hydroxylase superfamily)
VRLFTIEHSLSEYRTDLMVYGGAWLSLLAYLALATPAPMRWVVVFLSLAGIASWSLVEYLLHRFVLHCIRPFSDWHTAHHRRPTALICTPTILSAALMVSLVFLPAFALAGPWHACGLTFGMLSGYLAYTVTHHMVHHGRARGSWLQGRKRWHAQHHAGGNGHYGVTSAFWDHMFCSVRMTRA